MAPQQVWLVTGTSRGIGAEFVKRVRLSFRIRNHIRLLPQMYQASGIWTVSDQIDERYSDH